MEAGANIWMNSKGGVISEAKEQDFLLPMFKDVAIYPREGGTYEEDVVPVDH